MMAVKRYPPPDLLKEAPLSFAAEASGLLFVSGLPGFDERGALPLSFAEQFRRCTETLHETLRRANCGVKNVVKISVFLTRASDVAEMNKLYAEAFGPAPFPARTTLVVRALPDPGMLVELECIALLGP